MKIYCVNSVESFNRFVTNEKIKSSGSGWTDIRQTARTNGRPLTTDVTSANRAFLNWRAEAVQSAGK